MKKYSKGQLVAAAMAISASLIGCKQTQTAAETSRGPQQQSVAQQVSPELRLADHKAWIQRLLATPPVEQGIQQISAVAGSNTTVPIPTPPAFGGYSLQVDKQRQLAWLLSNGEQRGPWKLDNSDVVHILNSLQNPPAGVMMQSAAALNSSPRDDSAAPTFDQ